jgi:L-threonylcarbamoyladenylate synthase
MDKLKTSAQAIDILQAGGVGVLPTDTVYGLVARAANPKAVARLYALKHREHKPGTIIAANVEQLVELGIHKRYLTAVQHLWPNPLSIVIPVGEDLTYLHQGLRSLPFRIPADPAFRKLLEASGPLISSSANQPGKPPANTVAEAEAYFGDAADFYVDGGDLSGREPSTVIRVVDDAIEVLRPGALKIDETGRIGWKD